jgi:hypothetical protein
MTTTMRTLSALHLLAGVVLAGLGGYAAVVSSRDTGSSTAAIGLVIGVAVAVVGSGLAVVALVAVTGRPAWALAAGVSGLVICLAAAPWVTAPALAVLAAGALLAAALTVTSTRALR